MNFAGDTANSIGTMLSYGWTFLSNGGWVLVVFAVTYMTYKIYMKKIQDDFVLSFDQVFLHVKIERENLQSTLAVEQLFAQLHAVHTNFTWAERYLEGRVNMWLSFEMVSLGGKISFIMRTPKVYQTLLETAIYAHYPNAEITEVEDYLKNLEMWSPHGTWDLWGTEMKYVKDYAYPIRTYRDFEHPTAEEPIIDPLAGVFEVLSKAEPHELIALQMVIRPVGDKDWLPHVVGVVQELKKEGEHHETIWTKLMSPFTWVGEKHLHERLMEAGAAGGHGDDRPFPAMQRMSEGEKEVLKLIEDKMKSVGFQVKIRLLLIAPKGRIDKTKRTALVGALRPFSSVNSNSLKPDVHGTWTNYDYNVFKELEKPYVEHMIAEKKTNLLKGFRNRSMWVGAPAMIMNAAEIATLYHFPLATASTAPVERIDIKKGQPPANLPVA